MISPNPNRVDLDEAYMQMAEVWAKRSKANRIQVGCLIVKDRQIVSDGYNGMPAGAIDDVCELVTADGGTVTRDEVIHAESNALLKIVANGGNGAKGADMYCTLSPCRSCALLIIQSGVKRVFYRNKYRDLSGIDLLVSYNVHVECLSKE